MNRSPKAPARRKYRRVGGDPGYFIVHCLRRLCTITAEMVK